MVFFFSATGNSALVAQQISKELKEPIASMVPLTHDSAVDYNYEVAATERVILVFPVHSWGIPELVRRFLKVLKLHNHKEVWAVLTCGDDCGLTKNILAEQLKKQDIRLLGCFSVFMPNSYILMKGFDVDSEDVVQRKLSQAPERVQQIIQAIKKNESPKALYHKGSFAWIKSRMIYPLFLKFELGKTRFVATDACIGCRLCVTYCPTQNITMQGDRPIWGNDCIQCSACINRCPKRAIEYATITQNKGRYKAPHIERMHLSD